MNNKSQSLYQQELFIIQCLTNMHVGSGDESYGLVDKRIQRDVVTDLPTINASGLKGALREYYKDKLGPKDPYITHIFGTDSSLNPTEHKAGKFRFFSANLLSIPVRSDKRSYFLATSPKVLKELLTLIDSFGYPCDNNVKTALKTLSDLNPQEKSLVFRKEDEGAILEENEIKTSFKELKEHLPTIEKIMGPNLALLPHKEFEELCSDYQLPLIARNSLDNGRSISLWHEQVIPRESRFYFFVLKPNGDKLNLEFKTDEPVQIGGNASIGYGFTHISSISNLL